MFCEGLWQNSFALTHLLKKDSFLWGQEAQAAFEELKAAMVNLPVLAIPNFDKLFIIEFDASGKGVRAVLMLEGWPVARVSKALFERVQKKSVHGRELVIVLAIQKW